MKMENYSDNKIFIYLFYATWCGHCEEYLKSNTFEDIQEHLKSKEKYKNIVFQKIDFDQNKELANKYNINAFPTILSASSDGTLIKLFSGDRYNKNELKNFIDESLG